MNAKQHIEFLTAAVRRGFFSEQTVTPVITRIQQSITGNAASLKTERDRIVAEMKKGVNKDAKITGPAFIK